jgi:hypothetical protein
VTEINTPEFALRIRVIRLPSPGELDELEFNHFRIGQVYVVPSRLASILILLGIAELVEGATRAEAADVGHPRFSKGKPK